MKVDLASSASANTPAPSKSAPKPPTAAAERVLHSLLAQGPASAAQLAERLDMTAAGIRRHLDALTEAEYIHSADRPDYGPVQPQGRGRPAKVYSVTPRGRSLFGDQYDDLAVAALRFLQQTQGEDAVREFAAQRADEMVNRYLPIISGTEPLQRAEELADAMTQDGFSASAVDGGTGVQICQHNCPIAHVAAEFPVVCQEEARAMTAVLGNHVTRLATIAHGDAVCTSLVTTAPQGGTHDQHA